MNAERRRLMSNQLGHIDKGCLSDPSGFSLHHKNPETGNVTCCRGTNSIENDNLYLDQLTGKAVGIAKADRLITTFFELGNDRKMTSRLGRQKDWSDVFTSRAEELALINSMCLSVGFQEDELPFQASNPPELDDKVAPELGFDVSVPVSNGQVTGDVLVAAQLTTADDGNVETSDADYDEDKTDDIEPVAEDQPPNENSEEPVNLTTDEDLELAEFLEQINLAGELPAATQRKVVALSTETFKPESTMESFIRLTNQQEWVPFNHSRTQQKTAKDSEEASLFESLQGQYNRHVAPSAHRGYNAFEKAWNLEVAKRYLKAIEEGNNDTTFIKRKSAKQLQDHYDWLEEQLRQSKQSEEQKEDSIMGEMNRDIRDVRVSLPDLLPVPEATAMTFTQNPSRPMAVGNPLTMNVEIAAPGLVVATNRNPAPWRLATPLTPHQANNPLAGMNMRKWCRNCGHQKANHTKEEGFGAKCKRNWCAKCNKLKQHHIGNAGRMGPYCTDVPHRTSLHTFWHKKAMSEGFFLIWFFFYSLTVVISMTKG